MAYNRADHPGPKRSRPVARLYSGAALASQFPTARDPVRPQPTPRSRTNPSHTPILILPEAVAAALLCQYCRWALTHHHCPGCGRPGPDAGPCVACDFPGPLLGVLVVLGVAVLIVAAVVLYGPF